jgi:hypothetical protein
MRRSEAVALGSITGAVTAWPLPIRSSSTRRGLMAWALAFTGPSLLILLAWGLVGWSSATGRVRAEIEARDVHLYERLVNGEAVLESQRRIYMERFRRLEAQRVGT